MIETQDISRASNISVQLNDTVLENYIWVQVFSGLRIRLGTILGRFSIIYFRGLGLRIRVGVRVSVVLWSG